MKEGDVLQCGHTSLSSRVAPRFPLGLGFSLNTGVFILGICFFVPFFFVYIVAGSSEATDDDNSWSRAVEKFLMTGRGNDSGSASGSSSPDSWSSEEESRSGPSYSEI